MSMRSRLLPLLVLAACNQASSSSTPPPAAKDAGVAAAPADAAKASSRVADGGKLWSTYCALCHGDQAQGYIADNAPSLVSPSFLESVSDAFLRGSIMMGRPGTSMAPYSKNFGGPLTDDDIGKIIAWVRSQHTIDAVHPTPPGKGDVAKGQVAYDANCKVCHGDKVQRGNAVWLANSVFLDLASDGFLRHAIANGRPGTKMQAWEGQLGVSTVDDLVALLRSWATPGGSPPIAVDGPPPPPSLDGPIVINPKGKDPDFKPKDDQFVPAAEVKKAMDDGKKMVIVDARAPSDWSMMHIPGSVSIPYYAMDQVSKLPKDGTWILTYCACPHHESGVVLQELRKQGFPHTAIIDEGILFWQQQGYPVAVPLGTQGPVVPKLPPPDGKPVQ